MYCTIYKPSFYSHPRKWRGVAGLLAAAFLALNALALFHVRAMMRYADGGERSPPPEKLAGWDKLRTITRGTRIPRPTSDRQPGDLSATTKKLVLLCSDSPTLEAWYADEGPDTPLVLLFHGYASEKSALLPEARALLGMGSSVMLVDFRGSGGSSEAYTTIGLHEATDVATAYRFAREQLGHQRIILYGQSMGAAAILRAVSHHRIDPDGVILESVFDRLLHTVRNRFGTMRLPAFPAAELMVFWGGLQWGFDGFDHNPVDYATALNCPALFLHGAQDPRATVDEGRRVFAAAQGPKDFVVFAKAGHESSLKTDESRWRESVATVLGK